MNKGLSFGRNLLGAFADGAVLFPLLALLSMTGGMPSGTAGGTASGITNGFSSVTLLFTTGFAYVSAAVIFRVPMSVQPLKSIAVAAIAVGATVAEVKLSGLLLGIFCLFLYFFDVERLARRVPAAVIHQLQLGLGILLILQGFKIAGGFAGLFTPGGLWPLGGAIFMVLFPEIAGLPVLGLVATLGLFMAGFASGGDRELPVVIATASEDVRFAMIASLLLPQLALTLTNSVLATRNVARRYFGDAASRVTIRKLLGSIGVGNILVAGMGGMPFCHGSGGITAHIRGGSSKAWSTAFMGFVLLGLAGVQAYSGTQVLVYPPKWVVALLIAIGIFHLQLAGPTAKKSPGRLKLFSAFMITIATRNLLLVFGGALALEFLFERVGSQVEVVEL